MSRALAISNELKRKSIVQDATGNVINLPAPKNGSQITLSPAAQKRKDAIDKQEAEVTDFIKKQSDNRPWT